MLYASRDTVRSSDDIRLPDKHPRVSRAHERGRRRLRHPGQGPLARPRQLYLPDRLRGPARGTPGHGVQRLRRHADRSHREREPVGPRGREPDRARAARRRAHGPAPGRPARDACRSRPTCSRGPHRAAGSSASCCPGARRSSATPSRSACAGWARRSAAGSIATRCGPTCDCRVRRAPVASTSCSPARRPARGPGPGGVLPAGAPADHRQAPLSASTAARSSASAAVLSSR